jgi:hypothetical protein
MISAGPFLDILPAPAMCENIARNAGRVSDPGKKQELIGALTGFSPAQRNVPAVQLKRGRFILRW